MSLDRQRLLPLTEKYSARVPRYFCACARKWARIALYLYSIMRELSSYADIESTKTGRYFLRNIAALFDSYLEKYSGEQTGFSTSC
jgi:hypothetical protein